MNKTRKILWIIYANLLYTLFGIVIYREDKFRKYVEELGFIFPQGEYCKKGDFDIEFDCYPYLVQHKNNTKSFTTIKQFNKFYYNYA